MTCSKGSIHRLLDSYHSDLKHCNIPSTVYSVPYYCDEPYTDIFVTAEIIFGPSFNTFLPWNAVSTSAKGGAHAHYTDASNSFNKVHAWPFWV